MSNVASLNQIHVPDALKREQQKTNDMIVRKKSVQVTAISGNTFNAGDVIEVQIQSSTPFLVKSLKLMGKIKLSGDYDGNAKLHDGIHSIVKQVEISYNTQQIVNLNKDASFVSYVHKRSKYTQEEQTYRNVQELVGVNVPLTGDAPADFVMCLDAFGLDVPYLLPTGSGNKLTVRLTLHDIMALVFNGTEAVAPPAPDTRPIVTGFNLSECYLVCDQYTLTASADSIIKSALTSDAGAEYPMLAYDVHEQKLTESTNQNYLVPESYRNIVSNYFLPVPAITANGSLISTDNIFNGLNFGAGNIPQKVVVEFSGADPVNINGPSGQSGRAQHLQSLVNVSKVDLNDRVSGYGWGQTYAANADLGVFAGNFLKSDEKHAYIMNSGYNGYLSNAQCTVRFTLGNAPAANGNLLTIMQFTRVLKVSRAGTARMQ